MSLKKRLTKHDRYVHELRNRVKHQYDFISTNVKIPGRKGNLGEIDLVGRKGSSIDLYEVKCSHRIVKAKKQLQRMQRLLQLDKSRAYFYCGSSGALTVV